MGLLKECPKCKEMIGSGVRVCFNCNYDFNLQRVKTEEEIKFDGKQKQLQTELKEKQIQVKMELDREIEAKRAEIIQKNARYEYETVEIIDLPGGEPNIAEINETLSSYAMNHWRLHTVLVNQVGKTSNSVGFNGVSSGTNATIDATLLIFERCLKVSEL